MTFAACTYSPPEVLQRVLRTNRYPTIAAQMRTVAVQEKFRAIARQVISLQRWWHHVGFA